LTGRSASTAINGRYISVRLFFCPPVFPIDRSQQATKSGQKYKGTEKWTLHKGIDSACKLVVWVEEGEHNTFVDPGSGNFTTVSKCIGLNSVARG